MKLVTSELMRRIDREAIDKRGISGDILMENAGCGIAEQIPKVVDGFHTERRVAVFCGKGNNGGDGFVIGRHLHKAGHDVAIYFLGPLDELSADARRNFDRAAGTGIKLTEIKGIGDLPQALECDLIIDAVLGTGFSGAPHGPAAEIIDYINNQDTEVVSVDLPSGLNADNGSCEGSVVCADYTFTLALPKYGLYLTPGREMAGVVRVVPIGIQDDVIEQFGLKIELITPDFVTDNLPLRKPDGHKGDFGKLMVLAGSTGLTGAAAMAAESALRSGCGLVKVGCPLSVQPVLATKMTEAMTYPLPDVARKGALALRGLGEMRKLSDEHDAVVVGPGIGRHRETGEVIRRFVAKLDKPCLIDADGLFALSGHTEILKETKARLVLTPHPGEFVCLSASDLPTDFHERIKIAQKFAAEFGVVLVLKGSPTVVAEPNGTAYINQTGNNGMATGGSGDVLSGIIGSFLAQGMTAVDAAVCGVYVHGLAGDIAAEELTPRAMIAGDMIRFLPNVFQILE
jgi:hydroxyethylthiazole kinase-like uncharacterized protein yjeF